jgi:hypothetical protein
MTRSPAALDDTSQRVPSRSRATRNAAMTAMYATRVRTEPERAALTVSQAATGVSCAYVSVGRA